MKHAVKDSTEHKEKMLLVLFIRQSVEKEWTLPKVCPIELVKIGMEDFGYEILCGYMDLLITG